MRISAPILLVIATIPPVTIRLVAPDLHDVAVLGWSIRAWEAVVVGIWALLLIIAVGFLILRLVATVLRPSDVPERNIHGEWFLSEKSREHLRRAGGIALRLAPGGTDLGITALPTGTVPATFAVRAEGDALEQIRDWCVRRLDLPADSLTITQEDEVIQVRWPAVVSAT